VADDARAEELAQDVFAAVIEAAPRYQPLGRFRSYLFGIAYNVLMTDRRRRATATPFDLDPDAAPAEGVDADRVLWVRTALARLDQIDREILMLREYEGLSYDEIAELQQVPLNTVRSRLFRARMALRHALMPGKEEAR
jgi:RNA polymerase sigma-70 factor (ECF subfamily)